MFEDAFVLGIQEIVLLLQLRASHLMGSAVFLQVMLLDNGNAMGQPWKTRGNWLNAARSCYRLVCARCSRSSQAKMVYFVTLYRGRRFLQTQEGMLNDFLVVSRVQPSRKEVPKRLHKGVCPFSGPIQKQKKQNHLVFIFNSS